MGGPKFRLFVDVVNKWHLTKLLFTIEYDFFLCLFSLCSFIVFPIVLHVNEKIITILKKVREKDEINQVWQRKAVEFIEFGWYIRHRRHIVFYRVWLNSKTFKPIPFFWRTSFFWPMLSIPKFWPTPLTPKFYEPTPPTPKFQPMPPTTPTPNFCGPTLPTPPTSNFDPRQPRTHATHATHEPTQPT